ncbi:MAG: D-alanyl-D-alanine carboxypeptidase/D-alanyl-D-alanine-endopeptidase [Gammaproteobacteria bacterium RIFCSPHIGHO2_12_FULL_45_12]|nr:MAG: D-alanyl-D-alanine carboxypeptidase/D-alanyl-D-alanine-endopeptidase [Gammaproteobacteria bacterium RIFCSPHIGHO2_12_FULL_45_12]
MKLFKLLAITWIVCCLSSVAFPKHKKQAHSPTRAPIKKRVVVPVLYGATRLNGEINRLIGAANTKAKITVYVKSMQYGDNLFVRNINVPFTPASTLKLLTAEAGLLYLGPNYRFPTQLLTDASSVRNGVLHGNLYIVLSGDPTLTYEDLLDMMTHLQEMGVRAISGNVNIDNTAYDQRFYGPGWDGKDKSYCYAAPISASIINHNCISFSMQPAKQSGSRAQVVTSSKYFYPKINNFVVTKKKGTCNMRLSANPGSSISIEGCVSKGQYASGVSYVVTDVPDYNRALFKSLLDRMAISVYGRVTFGSADRQLSLISQHESEPLQVLVNEMLKKSDNIIAGALFKKIGQKYTRQPGSWENGSLAVSRILAKNAQVNIAGLRVLDGSGLSSDNLATAAQMMRVLEFAYHHDLISEHFVSALPISGVDGTLKHRMQNIIRKVRAKTGTISGVVSLAGYVTSKNKEPLGFVIMINGNKGLGWQYKALEDKIVTALTRYARTNNQGATRVG